MLQYEKIVASEGIDINKTSSSKECELCHYWYFKDVGIEFGVQIKSKYRVKKIPMSRFINVKLESDSESDSDSDSDSGSESKSNTELMAKLESNSDSDSK